MSLESITLSLSRCTLTVDVPGWSSGSGSLFASQEAPEFSERDEKALRARLKKLTPALEVLLDEFEARGLKLQREPIPGVASVNLDNGSFTRRATLRVEYSCRPRELGPLAYEFFARLQHELLGGAQGTQRADDALLLGAIERFEAQAKREPAHLRLRRWLELVNQALGGRPYVRIKRAKDGGYESRSCAVCGGAALEIDEGWTGRDWDATQHDALHSVCLAEPHVVTLFEN
ncbi:MAG: hypothetical protein QM817_15310 [Archangium sp.]